MEWPFVLPEDVRTATDKNEKRFGQEDEPHLLSHVIAPAEKTDRLSGGAPWGREKAR